MEGQFPGQDTVRRSLKGGGRPVRPPREPVRWNVALPVIALCLAVGAGWTWARSNGWFDDMTAVRPADGGGGIVAPPGDEAAPAANADLPAGSEARAREAESTGTEGVPIAAGNAEPAPEAASETVVTQEAVQPAQGPARIIQPARVLERVGVDYPPIARQARIQGPVDLEAYVSAEGTVTDVKVVRGNPLLVEAAIEAVRRWRYEPAQDVTGRPTASVAPVNIHFRLDGR